MGQSHSASGGTSGEAQDIRTSYYVLLGVERTAADDEIKKAYRKKALELHPDRNYGNEEEATKIFAEVQAAYEVLSDPQERAWYDSHESAILRGDDGGDADAPTYDNVKVTTADDLARLVRKFNSSVEFSDAPSGFFGFLRETFDQLAKEEEIAASWEDVDVREFPSFGHKDDSYGDVVKHFYAAWTGFSTVKSFSWRDKYRLSEAPDRWYRRRMEQENQRLRKEAKQEFNEAVRSLVAFVRKRDPRFVPNTQTEAERQKTLRDAAAAQAARARAANAAKVETSDVPEWAKYREPEELEESEEEEVEEEVFECVACNKTFKSEKQWEAHEKSKKHQKAVKDLQRRMRNQNAHLDLDSGLSSGVATPEVKEGDEEEGDEQDLVENTESEVQGRRPEEDDHSPEKEDRNPLDDDDDELEGETVVDDEEAHVLVSNKDSNTTQATVSSRDPAEQSKEGSESEDEDYAPREAVEARMHDLSLDTPATGTSENESGPTKPKLGKAAQKRAKKAAAAASGEQTPAAATCQVCHENFASRTKLFEHVKKEGHAALKEVSSSSGGKGKKGKGKR